MCPASSVDNQVFLVIISLPEAVQMHKKHCGHGYVPLRFGEIVVMRMGTQQQYYQAICRVLVMFPKHVIQLCSELQIRGVLRVIERNLFFVIENIYCVPL